MGTVGHNECQKWLFIEPGAIKKFSLPKNVKQILRGNGTPPLCDVLPLK